MTDSHRATLRQWLETEPFTLVMSSGFFSFFAHCGMLSVLEKEGLLPQKVAGSSAGAMIGACWAAGCSTESMEANLFLLKKADFWDPSPGFGLLKGNLFRKSIREMCPIQNLEDCRVPIMLSAFDIFSRKTRVLQQGAVAEAVYASCAVPFLFQPIRINGRFYLDGGIKDRPGMAGVAAGERVFYHHILSRSPWRRKNDNGLKIPERENMAVLAIEDLPRVGPDKLALGKIAFEMAREVTLKRLEETVNHDILQFNTEYQA